jgi:protein TonB
MFEQTFVDGRARTNRGWPVAVSLCFQITLICSAILVPLLNPALLPRAVMNGVFLAPLPPPPPPPPIQPVRETFKRVAGHLWNGGQLVAPREIPNRLAAIVDEAITEVGMTGFTDGVIGGLGNPFTHNIGQQWRTAPPPPPPPPPTRPVEQVQKPTDRIIVGGKVQEAMLLTKVIPRYPPLALQNRIEGVVSFSAVIGRDGRIQQLVLGSGHPLLIGAATAAVRQWIYRPTLLNGEPVEVATTITVTFTLNR